MVLRPTGRGRVGHRRNTRPPPHTSLFPTKGARTPTRSPRPFFARPAPADSRPSESSLRAPAAGRGTSSSALGGPRLEERLRLEHVDRGAGGSGDAPDGARPGAGAHHRFRGDSRPRRATAVSATSTRPRAPAPGVVGGHPRPGCVLQRPSRDAARRLRRRPVLVVGPPVPAAHPLPRADRCPRRRVYASPPGQRRCPSGRARSGRTPHRWRTSRRRFAQRSRRRRWARAAGAEVEPGEVDPEAHVQPFAPRRAGAIRGRAARAWWRDHDAGAPVRPWGRAGRRGHRRPTRRRRARPGVRCAPSGAQPSEGARTRSHPPARASPPPARVSATSSSSVTSERPAEHGGRPRGVVRSRLVLRRPGPGVAWRHHGGSRPATGPPS